MFNMVKLLQRLFTPQLKSLPPHLRRAVLQVERLEDRYCLNGTWTWNDMTGNTLWSNAIGTNWLKNGVVAGGKPVSGYARLGQ